MKQPHLLAIEVSFSIDYFSLIVHSPVYSGWCVIWMINVVLFFHRIISYQFQFCCSVSGDYFSHLDATGRRIDLDQRPELTKGSVEFVAPTEYMVRPPMPPLYFFLIDVSLSAVRSGMLEVRTFTLGGICYVEYFIC